MLEGSKDSDNSNDFGFSLESQNISNDSTELSIFIADLLFFFDIFLFIINSIYYNIYYLFIIF